MHAARPRAATGARPRAAIGARPVLARAWAPVAVRALAVALALPVSLGMAGPVAAKLGYEARFDAPIGMDTPGGTIVVVGVQVSVQAPGGLLPVEGSPVYLELTGRYGTTTRAAAVGDRPAGHYTATIEIPDGGARAVEVGIEGSSDIPVWHMNEALVFGPVTPATAQPATPEQAVKAGLAPPVVVEPATAVESARAEAAPAAPVDTPFPAEATPSIPVGIALAGAILLLVVVLVRRPRQRPGRSA